MSKIKIKYQQTMIDKRMLQLLEILKKEEVIRFQQEFLDAIGLEKENFSSRKAGRNGFTNTHMLNACRKYRVNANWLLGIEKNIFRD